MLSDESRVHTHHRDAGAVGKAVHLNEPAMEEHYSILRLARMWGIGRETIRLLVKDEPGVLAIRLGRKQRHTRYSVPASVAIRIHTRLRRRERDGDT
jgi:hypothetical protein